LLGVQRALREYLELQINFLNCGCRNLCIAGDHRGLMAGSAAPSQRHCQEKCGRARSSLVQHAVFTLQALDP
jgi:hypothetical protein